MLKMFPFLNLVLPLREAFTIRKSSISTHFDLLWLSEWERESEIERQIEIERDRDKERDRETDTDIQI